MKGSRLLAAGLVALGLMAVAPAASAEEACVGEEGTLVICVDPTGGVLYSGCVYAGGTTCQPVVVPGPEVTRCEGWPSSGRPLEVAAVIEVACAALT